MKIEFHYTYLIIALGFILTGYFPNLIIFTSIIIIHELGHHTIAKINKLNVEKIIIYPYGGLVKMNNPINTSIKKELAVAKLLELTNNKITSDQASTLIESAVYEVKKLLPYK